MNWPEIINEVDSAVKNGEIDFPFEIQSKNNEKRGNNNMNNEQSMWKIVEGRLNYRKHEFITRLKSEGVFMEYCEERGFLYEINMNVYGSDYNVLVGLKNGAVSVCESRQTHIKSAV